jgi:serine/threonine protein kinase
MPSHPLDVREGVFAHALAQVPQDKQVNALQVPRQSKTRIPLGEGTYGKVHATRLGGMPPLANEDEFVAIKVFSEEADKASGQGIPQMQLREIAALCSIPQHPHIIPLRGLILLGAGTSQQASVQAVMPLVRNGDAMHALERLHPMPWPLLFAWSCHLASAVCHLHASGWIHRDIKLENVLVGSNGELILCDFGLSRPVMDRPVMDRPVMDSQDCQAPRHATRHADPHSTPHAEPPQKRPRAEANPSSPMRTRIHTRANKSASCGASSAPPHACLQYTTEVCTIVTRAPELCILECLGTATTRDYDASADMWSLGACLLALATGSYAFRPARRGRNEDAVQAMFRTLGRPTFAEWPLLKRASERGIALGGATPSINSAEHLKRLAGTGRGDIPQAWWDVVTSLLQIIPGRRLDAPAALRALKNCASPAASQSLEVDGLLYAKATISASTSPSLLISVDETNHGQEQEWEELSPGARIFLPRHCTKLEIPCEKGLKALIRRRMLACTAMWECCRCAKLPPLVAIASILCARRIFEQHEVPDRNMAAIVCACVSLVAKQLMHCAPTAATLSRCMPSHLRSTHTAAERAEWWVLHVTCAVLVDVDYFAVLKEWPQPQQLCSEGLRICTVAALLACQESTSVEDAFQLSQKIMAGEVAQSSSCAIGRLRDAMKSGTAQSFFRAWADLWPDCTHILDVWAQR